MEITVSLLLKIKLKVEIKNNCLRTATNSNKKAMKTTKLKMLFLKKLRTDLLAELETRSFATEQS